jgi:hypothetical protein
MVIVRAGVIVPAALLVVVMAASTSPARAATFAGPDPAPTATDEVGCHVLEVSPAVDPPAGIHRPRPLPDVRLLLGCIGVIVVAAAIAGNHLRSRDDPEAPGHRRHRVDRDRRGGIHLG